MGASDDDAAFASAPMRFYSLLFSPSIRTHTEQTSKRGKLHRLRQQQQQQERQEGAGPSFARKDRRRRSLAAREGRKGS